LETYLSSSTNKLKPCGFLTDAFDKVLYLAELSAKN